MVHGKRSTLLPEDVEHAMEVLNVEVRIPHAIASVVLVTQTDMLLANPSPA